VSIAEEDQKYKRFIWKEFVFQYSCLPNKTSEKVKLTDLVLYHYQTQDGIVVQYPK
jgi:hypothetical protein